MNKIRVGFGYDVHVFAEGRSLWLGGIKIEHTVGLLGHSDADVLIHALCDALLGAANLRDIGYHFPDTAGEYKNIDSKILLKQCMELIRAKGYEFGNADCTICAEAPKINPHIVAMQNCLAEVMSTEADNISIKATTSEKMGFVGRSEGMAAYATVLITAGSGSFSNQLLPPMK
jgi:2-C-methyl-D-erythritol 2,4-cyclodiphosphate synthase